MTRAMSSGSSKVSAEHLGRAAYLYVRQSSAYQVEHHRESQRRQYDLAERAVELGWTSGQVVVVDEDQGKSGASAHARAGFARMVTAVGRGEVGIVLSLEASRLARNSPDWANLMYMCRYTGTLIADEHGIYDAASGTDRLVLGVRGQMSEMELDTSIHRMVEARWNKARRGEYLVHPPAGYEVDDLEQVVMSSDEAVVSALRLVFSKFDELPSARRVFAWWRDQGLQFPVRRVALRSRPIVWLPPAYRHFLSTLHNPIYAGAYAFGRQETVRTLDPEDPSKMRIRRVRRKEWPVLIKDHHPGYIAWGQFEQNQQRVRENLQMKHHDDATHRGPAREGWGLLQGVVRCGQCGRPMLVRYGGRRPSATSTRTLQYRCFAARRVQEGTECQVVGGKRVDAVVSSVLLDVVRGAGAEAGVLAGASIQQQSEEAERAWRAQIERAEYEAQRAERQFHAVEPENRLVVRTLEARWEGCLREVDALRAKATAGCTQQRPLTELEVARAHRLGADLERVWHAPTTTNLDRKQLLRAVIEEVQLRSAEKHYDVQIVWKGGTTTQHTVARVRRGDPGGATATPEQTVHLIGQLAQELDDAQIARVLNKQGRRTGEGNPFTAQRVAAHRNRHGIACCPKKRAQDPRHGPFTADEAAAELGVTSGTIHRWLREGLLPGRQAAPAAPWQIVLTEALRHKLKDGDAPVGWIGLTAAAKRLGLAKQHVAYLVKQGKLPAVRVVVAGRPNWRIDVSSATCGKQAALFYQIDTTNPREA